MKQKIQNLLTLKHRFGSVLFAYIALLLGFGWGVQRGMAQIFPGQGDDSTFSMGVFRITVDPAFRPLMDPAGPLAAYAGYAPVSGRLTSPLCIDNSTTIGRSSPNTRNYFPGPPIPIGAGSWDSVAGYAAYPAIPGLWAGALPPTRETEIPTSTAGRTPAKKRSGWR